MVEEVSDFQTEPVQKKDSAYQGTHATALTALSKGDKKVADTDFARWAKEAFAACISSLEEVLGVKFKRTLEADLPEKGRRIELIHHSVTLHVWDTYALEVIAQGQLAFSQAFHRLARHYSGDVYLVGALEPTIREASNGIFTFAWKQRVESSTEGPTRSTHRPEDEVRQ